MAVLVARKKLHRIKRAKFLDLTVTENIGSRSSKAKERSSGEHESDE